MTLEKRLSHNRADFTNIVVIIETSHIEPHDFTYLVYTIRRFTGKSTG